MTAAGGAGPRTGGQLVVETMQLNGVQHVFTVPGESFLPVLDALHDAPDVHLTVCRNEGGAAMMAEAAGKLTGLPGVCMVTRGPGACNASGGVHVAAQDSTPMILLIGQVERAMRGREAFQEVDYRQMFGGMAKWTVEIDDAARVPELLGRAFMIACSDRQGPVVVSLPEDMLADVATVPQRRPARITSITPSADIARRAVDQLDLARRPVLIVGGCGWSAEAAAMTERFASSFMLPVAAAFRRQDYVSNAHDCYIGDLGIGANPALIDRVRQADLIFLLGTRFGDIASQGYTLLDSPEPDKPLIHVYPAAREIGAVYRPELNIVATSCEFLEAVSGLSARHAADRAAWVEAARAEYLAWQEPQPVPGDVSLAEAIVHLRDILPPDAIVTNGAGNFAGFVSRYYRFRRYRTQLAPTSGSMGYGLPAAVAAKLLHPDRAVVCVAGDGDFSMICQEFMTAVHYDLPILVVVSNNGMFGTIRMHQERRYPGRISGTDLRNPSFAAFAEACGGFGLRVTKSADFPAACEQAMASGKPAVLELMTDPEAITTGQTLTALRTAAIARQQAVSGSA